MVESKNTKSSNLLNRKWVLIALLCGLPFFVLFVYLGAPGRGRAALIAVGVVVLTARACWDLKEYTWFWVTLSITVAFQASLVLLVPWTSKSYPGITLLPVGVADYAIVWGSIKLVEKVARK
ncbi:hypothetical protein [Granulicella mallensis]|uniref:Transmembrane protein n=1 Tax=Granulicella mallensis (strain ATCC BAA-1857 / DSM 23137 / MP5ACTX8) TaxID=682795 RepID=G8NRC2_GRAMM|nr:hypothetical protein [Granulicella mallensis]AEU36200.1 hypothetical protein AciX8_1864 [Granulicella mallensis MP5ACTX8]